MSARRDTPPRENLLRDGTALRPRELLRIQGFREPVLIGFRGGGGLSVYCGEDPVFHFNSNLELRRACIDGQLLSVERGKLLSLHRHLAGAKRRLATERLTAAASDSICRRITSAVREIRRGLAEGGFESLGRVPADGDTVHRFLNECAALTPIRLANRPHAV